MKTIKKLLITVAVLLCSVTANAHDFEVDGIYYNIISASDLTAAVTYKGNSFGEISNEYSGEVIIPETIAYKSKVLKVTSIGNSAFYGCSSLTSIEIPNSVTTIGNSAFSFCTGLTDVIIGNGVTSIGNSAFYGCSSLTSIEIPNSVTSIGYDTFSGCTGLTSIEIPNSVTTIGNSAFSVCTGLTDVIIGNGVTSIEYAAFYGCDSLKTVVNLSNLKIHKGSTSYGYVGYHADKVINAPNGTIEGDFVFGKVNGNNTLCGYIGNDIELSLPDNYKGENYVIGGSAFYGCSSLTNVTIGNSVTSIENYAFYGCNSLASIHLLGETPPTVDVGNFTEGQYVNIILYVPAGSLETYQNADTWKNFWDIREEGTTETPEQEVKKCATPVITYKNSGLDITTETDDAEIHTKITCNDVGSYNDGRIDLSATYNITTYATKTGYLDSETATATLCWIAVSGDSEDNSIIKVDAMPVLITCNNGTINICGGEDGTEVVVYTTSGVAVGNATITNGNATISTGLAKGEIAVINIAGKGIKVVMQ